MIRAVNFKELDAIAELAVAQLPASFEDFESEIQRPQASVEALITHILESSLRKGATDVHFEPTADSVRLRFRIDGFLELQNPLPIALYPLLLQRLKMMAGKEIDGGALPLEGQFHFLKNLQSADIRLATLPGLYGEAVTLRLLPNGKKNLQIENLGLEETMRAVIDGWLQKTYGWILVVGPTGAGKSTTLYAMLQELVKSERKIITVEDPVEIILPGVSQVSVRPELGLDFPKVLRAAVRQAPNVILIGEIRDACTAEIALNAALTGHLVLASMHAENTHQALERLVYFGLNRSFIQETLLGILAQRLVPRRCTQMREKRHPEDCFCGGKGFKGRIGIFESLSFSDPSLKENFISFASDLNQKIKHGHVDPSHLQCKQLFRRDDE